MPISAALACLCLAPLAPAPATQSLNATGTQVKSAFTRLESAWSRQDIRPRFFLNRRWSFVGAFVTAPRSTFNWTDTLDESQELKFSIAGDTNVQSLSVTVTKVGESTPVTEAVTGESFMSDSFVAPSSGRYNFSVSCQPGIVRPAFILLAFESSTGHSVSKGAMAELGLAAGAIYSEGTGTGDLDFAKNRVSLMGGAFDRNSSKSVINLPQGKAPGAFIGGFEGERETLTLSVSDKAGKVVARDPGDEDLPYVLLDRVVPNATLTASNRSAKPRICFVAGFHAK